MVKLIALTLVSAMLQQASMTVYSEKYKTDLVYSCHLNESNKIALTFDDGPHPSQTPEILDILSEYDVPATFFVIGKNIELYGELVKREIDEGHEIGNHTFSHRICEGSEKLREELEVTHELIYEADEYAPKLFRPPGGKYGEESKLLAAEFDYRIVLWNIDTRDWAHTPAEEIVKNVSEKVKSGDIILFHDYISGVSPTASVLKVLIPQLLERGFVFVTVSELLGSQ